jgi:hypothetical protein
VDKHPTEPEPRIEHDAAPPALAAEVTVRESAISTLADLADLARQLPGPDPAVSARVMDRLAEEMYESAAMLRALPGRPAAMSGHDYALLGAIRTAHAAGEDVAETIARALARLAAELGGSSEVLRNRPGSWEASSVRELLRGTVGPDDEALPMSDCTSCPATCSASWAPGCRPPARRTGRPKQGRHWPAPPAPARDRGNSKKRGGTLGHGASPP